MEVAGRRALVTGAAIGSGRAIALALAAAGAEVVVSDVEHLIAEAAPAVLVNNAGGGAIVNVASTAGVGTDRGQSPE